MSVFARILRLLVTAPELRSREGKPPYACFSQLQFIAYPELCATQAQEALGYCDEQTRRRQAKVLQAYFGLSV